MIIMDGRPHIDGLTRGTVVEYDGWQWGVVTEIAEEMDPTKVGFVLVDELGDWVVRELEEARGCWEHYEAVRTFRDGEHEYWTSDEYIQDDDMWEVLGPIHPDARDNEHLVTDGGVDQSEAEIDRGNYRYATTVKQTMYDPVNDVKEGTVEIVAGQFGDGVIRTVFDAKNGGFLDIEGDQIEQFHADFRMSEKGIKRWAQEKANQSEVDYSDV